jgi:hypothetical protein
VDNHAASSRRGGEARRHYPPPGDPGRPAAVPMSAEERTAIRNVGAEDARRSRARQGLPERIEDPAAVAVLAALLRAASASEPKESNRRHEGNLPYRPIMRAADTSPKGPCPPHTTCEALSNVVTSRR